MAPWDSVWMFHNHHCENDFYPTIAPRITEQDHIAFKKKTSKCQPSSVFTFSSKIPETSEILNIFYLKREKSISKKKSGVKKMIQTPIQDILSGMEEMQVVLQSSIEGQNMDMLRQIMIIDASSPSEEAFSSRVSTFEDTDIEY
jgi:hypothetical protein